ncbi:PAS domain S-box protein [Desulfoluna butyratoxydans]|uniref:histidine kinase n=1 Tax=Desulfoluna butyratoxydans TaxID=231438 RepID=A0A4U8YPP1_9BACT|nr:PAS domain S-box protein [Desulfoluna butyratoxydans]VFQ43213.1 pas fold-4 [Desulfoluna butyratoxydans]
MQKKHKSAGIHDIFACSSTHVSREIDAMEDTLAAQGGDRRVVDSLRKACARLEHVHCVHRAVRRSLAVTSGMKSPEVLIGNVCRTLVDAGGYESVWIVLFGTDRRQRTWAQSGMGEKGEALGRKLEAGWLPRCGRDLLTPEGGYCQAEAGGICASCSFGSACSQQGSIVTRLARGGQLLGMMSVTLPSHETAGDEEACLVQEVEVEVSRAIEGVNRDLDRAETEAGLGESRRVMDTLLKNLPGMAYRCKYDGEWTMVLVSRGGYELTGYHPEEMVGNRAVAYNTLVHPEDRAMVKETVDAGVSGSDSFEMEYRLLTRDGTEKWVWEKGSVVRIGGVVVALEGFVTDITQQKHAIEGLRWSNRRYRILVEDMPAMVCRFLPDGRLTDVNESYCRMFGMAREELLGQNFFAFLPPAVRDPVRDHFLELTPENPMDTYEHEVINPTGRRGWQEWTDRAIFSDDGELREFQSIGRDITERRRAEEALRASERRYRAYIDNSPVGIFIFGEEGGFVEANEAACRMVGYTRSELAALKVIDIVGADGTGKRAPNFERLKREEHVRSETPLHHKNGAIIHGIIEAVALGEGTYMAYFIDQTEQRKLQSQLQQVQKIESVGRLAAGVAHDFNNMLSPILGYAELLLDELPEGEECYGYSLEIKNAAERSRNLVRQLLAFSRKQVLRLDPLDLRAIVAGMQPLLRQTLREDIALTVSLAETSCPVRADMGQVEQILMNLAVNAQDAMPDGGELSIAVRMVVQEADAPRLHLDLSPGEYVLVEVRDTGHGMDPTTAEHAFEPFFSTKGKGGTGLGLSTVYGIITQHGGAVRMDTRQGEGAVFSLYFLREEEPVAEMPEVTEEKAVASGHETVLVAEDNEVVRNMTVSVLTRLGYRVFDAAGGEEALAVLKNHEGAVDLLLTDVVMPGMNGRELYTRVSQLYSGIRVLYMSGYSDDVIAHHGVLEEGIHFIQKPFTIEGLTSKVREVLDIACCAGAPGS